MGSICSGFEIDALRGDAADRSEPHGLSANGA